MRFPSRFTFLMFLLVSPAVILVLLHYTDIHHMYKAVGMEVCVAAENVYNG
jgi:hypothetical protein